MSSPNYGSNVLSMSKLLSKGDATIFQVLVDPGLASSIRTAFPAFVTFVTKKENLEILLDINLTTKYCEREDYRKILKGANQVLTSQTTGLMSPIMMSMTYISRMIEMLESPTMKTPDIAAGFYRLCEAMIRYTHGEFIRDLPNYTSWLIDNCYTFSLRDLLTNLIIDYPNQMKFDQDSAHKVCKNANSPIGYFVMRAMLNLFKSQPKYISCFQSDSLMEILLNATIQKDLPDLTVLAIFRVIQKVTNQEFPLKEQFVNKYSQLFFFDRQISDNVLTEALYVLKTDNYDLLARILDSNTPSRLREAILNQFQRMSDEEFSKAIETMNLPQKIVESITQQKHNSSLMYLIQLIDNKHTIEDVEGWSELVSKINKSIEQFNKPYAGSPPNVGSQIVEE